MARNYVNNAELLVEIEDYQQSDVMSERLGEILLNIARQYSSKGNFSGYTWRDDMVGEAVLTCVKYLRNFNRDKSSNPFSYITQICYNSFVNYIKTQRKHSLIKDYLYKAKLEEHYCNPL